MKISSESDSAPKCRFRTKVQIPHQSSDSAPIGGKNHQLEGGGEEGEGEEEQKNSGSKDREGFATISVKKSKTRI